MFAVIYLTFQDSFLIYFITSIIKLTIINHSHFSIKSARIQQSQVLIQLDKWWNFRAPSPKKVENTQCRSLSVKGKSVPTRLSHININIPYMTIASSISFSKCNYLLWEDRFAKQDLVAFRWTLIFRGRLPCVLTLRLPSHGIITSRPRRASLALWEHKEANLITQAVSYH